MTDFYVRRALPVWVLAIALAALAMSPARAQDTTPGIAAERPAAAASQEAAFAEMAAYPDVHAYLAQSQFARALAALQGHESAHENDPHYFNLVGILALKSGDYHAAATAFERVVIMQPDNAGAWLDLAIATTETGNNVSAIGYFDHIETQFDPPPALRAVIAHYRAGIAARTKIASPWQFNVLAFAGVDSNANSGLQNSAIPLTLGAERVELVLDPAFQARRDNFAQLGVDARYRRQFSGNLFELVMGARQRSYTHEHAFSTLDLNLSTGLHRPTYLGDTSIWLHLEHLALGGNALLRNVHAVAQVERPYAGCRLGVSAETEWRRYINLKMLDANVVWGQLGFACDWNLAQVITQTTLIGRIGLDSPIGNRPGGETRRAEVIAQIGAPLAWGARAELSMTLAAAQDADGYSALLEQNAARRLERRNVRFLMTVPLSPSSEFMLTAEDNRFVSNLALFQQSGKSLSVGLRQRF